MWAICQKQNICCGGNMHRERRAGNLRSGMTPRTGSSCAGRIDQIFCAPVVGLAAPATFVLLSAVTVSDALVMVKVPATYVTV